MIFREYVGNFLSFYLHSNLFHHDFYLFTLLVDCFSLIMNI